MRIVVDAMGSDEHPGPDVGGAVMAARKFGDTIILVGDEARVKAELSGQNTAGLSIEVVHADESIGMKDSPAAAARDKRHSSMHVGMQLVRDGAADAFVSAGNTGGILAVATLRQTGFGRIPGILRPAMGVVFPIESKPMLIDNGANADARPEYLLQFGLMGSIYMSRMHGIDRPRVALISNGEEEGKTFYEIITEGDAYGMWTFDQHIMKMFTEGKITEDTAMTYASRKAVVGRGIDTIKSGRGEKTTDIDELSMDESFDDMGSPFAKRKRR